MSAAPVTLETPGDLLHLLYGAVGRPDTWSDVVTAIAASYPAGRCSLAVHDRSIGADWEGATAGWERDRVELYYRHYAKLNPWLPNLHRRPVGRVVPAEFMLPRAELIRSELFQDFLRPMNLDSGLTVTIQQDGSRAMLLSVLFPSSVAERDPAAVDRLQQIVPHLQRAAQLHRQMVLLQTRAATAEAAGEVGMLLLDRSAHVRHTSERAAQILARNDGLSLRAGQLHAWHGADDAALRTLINGATAARDTPAAKPGGALRIQRPSGAAAHEVLVTPIAAADTLFRLPAVVCAMFLREPADPPPDAASLLTALYGFTRAEMRLAGWLLQGISLPQAAEQANVSRETMRTHLRALFVKTGTSRQNDLIRRLTGSLNLLPRIVRP